MPKKIFFPAPHLSPNAAAPLTLPQIKHVVNVASVSGRTPERDKALLLCSITMGLRVTEIARIELGHIMNEDGSYKLEGWIPGRIAKMGKSAPIFPVNKRFQKALDDYLEYRIKKRHQLSGNETKYRGLKPDQPIFLTETGYAFAMGVKKRTVGSGNKKEIREYTACDVLERVFKRIYVRAFGEETKCSSHSGRKTFCNRLMELVESKRVDDTDIDDVVRLMRSHDLTSIQPYLVPTNDEIRKMSKLIYAEKKD